MAALWRLQTHVHTCMTSVLHADATPVARCKSKEELLHACLHLHTACMQSLHIVPGRLQLHKLHFAACIMHVICFSGAIGDRSG